MKSVIWPCEKWARCLSTALLPCLLVLAPGCATRSGDVLAKPADPVGYADWTCERLFDETDAVQQRAADVAYAVDSLAGNNIVALGLGMTVFWPALLAMRPDGDDAAQLADLKGRFEALRGAAATRDCGAPPEAMAAHRQAAFPVALGDRLVYEERSGAGAAARSLVLQVKALRREQIEFLVELNGRALATSWRQDLAGNTARGARAPLIGWQRLLKPGLVLGQVLVGDLAGANEVLPSARVRGQVVATGPQALAGREFDVAVIELFGEAPQVSNGEGESTSASTRLDGVMAIDRRSGLLLRLDLRCANPEFALRRRLLRVESSVR